MHDDLSEYQAQLAERDAEIESLKAELAGVIEGHKAQVDMLAQVDIEKDRQIANLKRIVAERSLKVNELKAQMAELQAWKDAVPMNAIAFLVGAVEASVLGVCLPTRIVTDWANKMLK